MVTYRALLMKKTLSILVNDFLFQLKAPFNFNAFERFILQQLFQQENDSSTLPK